MFKKIIDKIKKNRKIAKKAFAEVDGLKQKFDKTILEKELEEENRTKEKAISSKRFWEIVDDPEFVYKFKDLLIHFDKRSNLNPSYKIEYPFTLMEELRFYPNNSDQHILGFIKMLDQDTIKVGDYVVGNDNDKRFPFKDKNKATSYFLKIITENFASHIK